MCSLWAPRRSFVRARRGSTPLPGTARPRHPTDTRSTHPADYRFRGRRGRVGRGRSSTALGVAAIGARTISERYARRSASRPRPKRRARRSARRRGSWPCGESLHRSGSDPAKCARRCTPLQTPTRASPSPRLLPDGRNSRRHLPAEPEPYGEQGEAGDVLMFGVFDE